MKIGRSWCRWVMTKVRVSEEEEEVRVRVFALIPYKDLKEKDLRGLISPLRVQVGLLIHITTCLLIHITMIPN